MPEGPDALTGPTSSGTSPDTPLVIDNPNEVITELPGQGPNVMTTLGRLNELANDIGPTTEVFTKLSEFPNPDRTLSLAAGSRELADVLPNPKSKCRQGV